MSIQAPRNPCRSSPCCQFNPSCRSFTVSFSLCFVPFALGDEVITLNMIKSAPVGPVAGGIMGCIMVLVLAVYAYRHQIHRRSHQHMSPLAAQGELGSGAEQQHGDGEKNPSSTAKPKGKAVPKLSPWFCCSVSGCREPGWRRAVSCCPLLGTARAAAAAQGACPDPKGDKLSSGRAQTLIPAFCSSAQQILHVFILCSCWE